VLAKSMMSKKASRLYERMQHGIEKKKAKPDKLHKKRKQIDAAKAKEPKVNVEPAETKVEKSQRLQESLTLKPQNLISEKK